jgi:hypothetical protein
LLLKLLFFAFSYFSLKLLIFGGHMLATENNPGEFRQPLIFGVRDLGRRKYVILGGLWAGCRK